MASSASRVVGLALASFLGAGCAGTPLKYPLADPIWTDPDKRPFKAEPDEYFSPFAWDGANQTLFRPISRFFAVDPAGRAINVNALDEVPNSSWFENRLGRYAMTPEQVAQGPCKGPLIDPAGPWTVTGAKPNGANPGFPIKAQDGRRYMVKFDGTLQGPRATAADVLVSKIYHAAGYYVPCNSVVFFDRSILKIKPGATTEDEHGDEVPLTQAALDRVFEKSMRLPDGRYRASTSLFIEGKPIGPWTYEGTRSDDPNDVVAHEDRRELRGMQLLAAWTNHFDSREQNTLAAWMGKDSNPGYVRHYVIDFGDCLGSIWEPPMLGRRIGHAYYLDFRQVVEDWLTLGLIERPWDRNRFGPSGTVFAYFDVEEFTPDAWHPGYPNPAFVRAQEGDAAWMARIIAEFSDAHLEAVIATAHMQDEFLRAEALRILKGRRDKILRRYLSVLSPLAHPELRARGNAAELCLKDLALSSGIQSASQRRYSTRAFAGEELTDMNLGRARLTAQHRVCLDLPDAGAREGKPRYLIVDIAVQDGGGELTQPARVHLYQLTAKSYRVVGLEHAESSEPPG